jgi:hypothetical protein
LLLQNRPGPAQLVVGESLERVGGLVLSLA